MLTVLMFFFFYTLIRSDPTVFFPSFGNSLLVTFFSHFPLIFVFVFIVQLLNLLIISVVPWEGIFNLGAATDTTEFCELVEVPIEVYIPHQKYWVQAIDLLSF